jgi:hypothetical protein
VGKFPPLPGRCAACLRLLRDRHSERRPPVSAVLHRARHPPRAPGRHYRPPAGAWVNLQARNLVMDLPTTWRWSPAGPGAGFAWSRIPLTCGRARWRHCCAVSSGLFLAPLTRTSSYPRFRR